MLGSHALATAPLGASGGPRHTIAAAVRGALVLDGQGRTAARPVASAQPGVPITGQGVTTIFGTGFVPLGAAPLSGIAQAGLGIRAGSPNGALSLTGRSESSNRAPSLADATAGFDLMGESRSLSLLHAGSAATLQAVGSAQGTIGITAHSADQLALRAAMAAPQGVIGTARPALILRGAASAQGKVALQSWAGPIQIIGQAQAEVTTGATNASRINWAFASAVGAGIAGGATGDVFGLTGQSASSTLKTARSAGVIAWMDQAAGQVASSLRGLGGIDLSAGVRGSLPCLAALDVTFSLARDAQGDAAVVGESARQFGLFGKARAWSYLAGQSRTTQFLLNGIARGATSRAAEASVKLEITQAAESRAGITAIGQPGLTLQLQARATLPRRASGWVNLALLGSGQGRAVTLSWAAMGLNASGSGHAASDLIARCVANLGTAGRADAVLTTTAGVSGHVTVIRRGGAALQVAGAAIRGLPVTGAGRVKSIVSASGVSASTPLRASAATRLVIKVTSSPRFALASEATATGHSVGTATSAFGVNRDGQGILLVEGEALRGLAFGLTIGAQSIARSRADILLAPWFTARIVNAIQGSGLEQTPNSVGHAEGQAAICTERAALDWELRAQASALRVPPALRRAVLVQAGRVGHLTPSNSGQILRG